jgi:hypothetical protein
MTIYIFMHPHELGRGLNAPDAFGRSFSYHTPLTLAGRQLADHST